MQNLGKKIYLSIFALIVAFVGIFGLFFIQKDNITSVSADEIASNYSFNGSNLYYYVGFVDDTSNDNYIPVANVPCVVQFSINSSNNLTIFFSFSNYNFSYNINLNDNINNWNNGYINYSTDPNYFIAYSYIVNWNFVPNLRSVTIVSEKDGYRGNANVGHFDIIYTDAGGSQLHFQFACRSNGMEYSLLNERTYYFAPPDLSDNDYYQIGLQNGINEGYDNGFNAGTLEGYNNGFNAGKNLGFDEGVASANDYSFLGLIGAVVDAPLNMFIQTFDFNILGFNMKDFFLSILTIALIFTIIRLCMGGKS